ncbi:MAG: aminotransferase class V-fold PLP-dependent enzyme [Kofleriaceae bacterium]|nr:aminotransferase class V-fold PLP-dependent enzyme [Kofleriaceae bacterium]
MFEGPGVADRRGHLRESRPVPLDPRALRAHYTQFLSVPSDAPRRILLTGHSHQAWPDVARAGQDQAYVDAALHVDDKWDRVFAMQDELRAYIAERMGVRAPELAFASNTHELVTRFLSALDLRRRPHLVTTTGEFHSMNRQLRRLAEEGIEITWVEATPADTLAERLAAEVRDTTAAVLVSSVLFETSSIVRGLDAVAARARNRGARILVDAYHAWHVVPFTLADVGGEDVFVVAGGYKYAQWGEGTCFLRVPSGHGLRPVYTGWFAGFAELEERHDRAKPVGYSADGASAFAGSTFDPASVYRAVAVTRFARSQGLEPAALRALSMRQTNRIVEAAQRLGLPIASPLDAHHRGGFVAIETDRAAQFVTDLRPHGIFVDARGTKLRIGPAPYVTEDEIDTAMEVVGRLVRR